MRRIALSLGLLLTLPGSAQAGPVSATTLRTTVDTGPTKLLVAVEQKSPRQLRVVVLRVDDAPGDDDAYVLALSGGACKTGPEFLRLNVRDRNLIDVRRRIPREAIGGRLQWGIREIGAPQEETANCRNAGALARRGTIISPRDTASGQATGVFALRLTKQRVQVTSLVEEEGIFYFGASRRECDDDGFAASKGDSLWQWRKRKAAGTEVSIETLELWNSVRTRSFATVAGNAKPGRPHSCLKWPLAAF